MMIFPSRHRSLVYRAAANSERDLKPNRETNWIRVGTVDELRGKRVAVVEGADRPISIWVHGERFVAVDNRCPHLGFPLHRGTLKDGILTCQWHQARFDVCSGCTFDRFAGDVATFETKVEDGVVYVASHPCQTAGREHYLGQLHKALRENVALAQAKAIVGLLHAGVSPLEILKEIARFAAKYLSAATGVTELAITGNLMPVLSQETVYFLLLRSSRTIAAAATTNRAPLEPLEGGKAAHPPDVLMRWLRQWVAGRERDGTERILRTAAHRCHPQELAEMLLTATGDQVYRAQGHNLDFANKTLELLDLVGWDMAAEVVTFGIDALLAGRGVEESAAWHEPIELLAPLRAVEEELPGLMEKARGLSWQDDGKLVPVLIGDDPLAIIGALRTAVAQGAAPAELSKRVAYAAALRLARFADANEVGDWFNPQHTFTYANAVHQAVKRCPTAGVARSVFHAALSVYMDRFLNIPPARLPGETAKSARELEKLPSDAVTLRRELLQTLDRQANLHHAASLVVRYLRLKHPLPALVDTLALATVREDLDFHTLQVLEAGYQQAKEWPEQRQAEQILVGVIRDLAAFCPTRRGQLQTAKVALRLDRGEQLFEAAEKE